MSKRWTKRWTARERRIFASLKTPSHIQRYLDELEYDIGEGAASPRVVMRTGKAHCYGGALFACAALRELGHRPRMMFIDAVSDDGHCIALYQEGEVWGAVAKSNFTTIRSREPIYSYLALGLSYFDGFFNSRGKRTMRSFTEPVDLEQFEPRGWRFAEDKLRYIDRAIDNAPLAWKLDRRVAGRLGKANQTLIRAGLLGANPKGLWRRGK
jgi:hypothetical protein